MIKKIRSGQETSIGTKLEDWVSDQGIEWDWSSKNTPEQNGKSERFDGTFCIAHIIDEFTSFNWVFPLIDHQEKTLMPMFKSLINRCDRTDLSIMPRIMIKKIRSEQKISIDTKLKDWVSDQNIE
jgi:hypothetical protein